MDTMKNLLTIALSLIMIVIIGFLGVSIISAWHFYTLQLFYVILTEIGLLAIGTYFLNKLTK